MSNYIVQPGQTISDVVLNATGTLANLDAVLEANAFTDWTPDLFPGQSIIIPDTVTTDANALRQLVVYPLCNFSISGIYAKIQTIFDILTNNWILTTGYWNDNAVWLDSANWNDGV